MKLKPKILALAIFALAPAMLWAADPVPGDPGTGLAATAHDFSGQSATSNSESWTTGLCTFCHTPHKAISTSLLWNHTLSTKTFSWDETKTTAGTTYATFVGNTYKGPTAKCLSCHDGSVAIGDIAWFGEGKPTAFTTGSWLSTYHGEGDKFNVGFGGSMAGNHPVAMPYPYLNVANTYNGVRTGDNATLSEWQATPLSPVRVFNDNGLGNITSGPATGATGIECSSCHDPHNKASVDDLFLRGKLSGNDTQYICLKCHIK